MNTSKAYLVNNAGRGGVPLTMDGASAAEGRVEIPVDGASYIVLVPIPAGVNTMQVLRFEAFAAAGVVGDQFATRMELPVFRLDNGNLQVGSALTENPVSVSSAGNNVEFQLDANVSPPSPNSRLWAWRWTLSPVYPATFPLTAPP